MILDNLKAVLARLAVAARRAGRDPSRIALTAVTKMASVEAVEELARTGLVANIGENRVQDAARKAAALKERTEFAPIRWRMIGHLQRNKVRQALDIFDVLDSLDSLRLAGVLQEILEEQERSLPVLVQVKLSEREVQHGVAPEELGGFLEALGRFDRLRIAGLMAIAPMLEPVEAVRPYFRRMKDLFDGCFPDPGLGLDRKFLSMGMSRDFELAVEEGSDMVRVGSALFR